MRPVDVKLRGFGEVGEDGFQEGAAEEQSNISHLVLTVKLSQCLPLGIVERGLEGWIRPKLLHQACGSSPQYTYTQQIHQ